MALLDVQRAGQQTGRIRIGMQVPTGKKNQDGSAKMRPDKLSTFRFTTRSQAAAETVAAKFGGTVREWNGEYEVITKLSVIPVMVPPRDAVISQWYEMWNRGGAIRRCDSRTEQISGGPCLCPHAENPHDPDEVTRCALERAQLASQNPPKACKPVSRLSVMVPDLPDLGVWRIDTSSWYAARELGDKADMMQMARDKGIFLRAVLRIDQRSRVAGGTTKHYPVPVLELLDSARDIASGALEAGGFAAALPPAPGEAPKAIAAGQQAPAAPKAAKPQRSAGPVTAQQIADDAASATTREEIEARAAQADEHALMDDHITTPGDDDGTVEELRLYLAARWQELPAAGSPPAQRRPPVASPADSSDDGSLFNDPSWADRAEAGQMSRSVRIKAHVPWDRQDSPETPADAAPRRDAFYKCPRCGPFTITLAAEAKPPAAWDCRKCGKTGRLDGAPEGAEAALPGYTCAAEQHQRAKREPVDPWSQLMKRRTIAELEANLAERLAELKAGAA